jgi:hypothetical protein
MTELPVLAAVQSSDLHKTINFLDELMDVFMERITRATDYGGFGEAKMYLGKAELLYGLKDRLLEANCSAVTAASLQELDSTAGHEWNCICFSCTVFNGPQIGKGQ